MEKCGTVARAYRTFCEWLTNARWCERWCAIVAFIYVIVTNFSTIEITIKTTCCFFFFRRCAWTATARNVGENSEYLLRLLLRCFLWHAFWISFRFFFLSLISWKRKLSIRNESNSFERETEETIANNVRCLKVKRVNCVRRNLMWTKLRINYFNARKMNCKYGKAVRFDVDFKSNRSFIASAFNLFRWSSEWTLKNSQTKRWMSMWNMNSKCAAFDTIRVIICMRNAWLSVRRAWCNPFEHHTWTTRDRFDSDFQLKNYTMWS